MQHPPALSGPVICASPMRFYAPRKPGGDARMTDVHAEFRSRSSSFGASTGAMSRRKTLESSHLRPASRARSENPNRALETDPVVQAPPHSFRRPLRVMRQRVLWLAFRYPMHADLRGLAGTTGPSLCSPGGAHGVQPFAGSFPHTVGNPSLSRRTHMPLHRAARPDWFSSGWPGPPIR